MRHINEEDAMDLLRKHRRAAFPQKTTPSSFAIRLLVIAVAIIAQQHHVLSLGFELSSSRQTSRCSTFLRSFPPNTLNHDVRTAQTPDLDSSKVEDDATKPKDYFISEALFVHLGPAAHILTDAFYSHRTNFVTFQIEKLKTALSLESTYAKQKANPWGQMFVACSSRDGKVLGFAEVDTCSLKNEQCNEVKECGLPEDTINSAKSDLPRPYMYNLAVDKRWKRKGIATSLVVACERFAVDIDYADLDPRWLYLRVRKSNDDAIAFYQRLGYREIDPESIALTKNDVNSGSAEEGELVLMGKQLLS
ncbi:hypothetical protein ACHAW6_008742 [Cyclotella cf. meneghiniana]